jgi:gamma-glutamyltranspeptidase / glutathione hydrolase
MKRLVLLFLLVAAPLVAAPVTNEPLRVRHAVVASVSEIASQVGAGIMKKGGNAIDATVAVAFALQVVWPEAGNIGGGGFLVYRAANGKTEVIDYRETAPRAATRDMYLDAGGNVVKDLSTVGAKSAGVPGTVAGLVLAHKKWGTLKWADLVEPARKLAASGFVVSKFLDHRLNTPENVARLSKFPESRRIYLRAGAGLKEGETFVQPDLAKTLARIQKDPDDFYKGLTARMMIDEVKAAGGILTMQDLAEYVPAVRTPLTGTYRGYEIITMPPPSSGGVTLMQMLSMLETKDVAALAHNSVAEVHLLLEVERRAYADRAKWLGDTDFVKVPIKGLLDKHYATAHIASFDPLHATPSASEGAGNPLPYESPQTTHFSIVDEEGNAVANTYTLNDSFGSAVTVRGAGFLLNDEMDDFTSKPGVPNFYGLVQGEANAIAPHKRPLSSMTPAMVLKNGKLLLVIGSPGGGMIINTVLQVIVNVIDYGMNLQQAINAPRFHHQWLPDEVYWESGSLPDDLRASLEEMGYRFRSKPEDIGDAAGVMIDPKTGERLGASDWRRGGWPAGF